MVGPYSFFLAECTAASQASPRKYCVYTRFFCTRHDFILNRLEPSYRSPPLGTTVCAI